MAKLGVFCIENWSGNLANRDSVQPVLEFLERSGDVRTIHQRVSSVDELQRYFVKWRDRRQYPVGYLALHGERGGVRVGRESLTLDDLIDATTEADTERFVHDLAGKVLFIASCSTMAMDRRKLARIREETGLHTVCGYARDVEWYESAAFDLLVLAGLAGYKAPANAFKWLRREHGGFARWMRFKTVPDRKL